MSDNLPEGWIDCVMGEVADVIGGGTPDTKHESNFSTVEGVPWITPADLSNYRDMYISRGKRFLTEKGFKASSARLLPKGSVLFSSRAPIGYVAISANEVTTNQGFKSFVCKNGIDPEYLYFYMKYAKPLAEELASGTTFAEISGKNAAKIPVRIAPISEQLRIANKLKEVLAKVETCQSHLEKVPILLKRFRQSVLAAACSGRLTEDWRPEHTDIAPASKITNVLEKAHEAAGGHRRGNAAPPTEDVHTLEQAEFPDTWTIAEMRSLVCPDRAITYGILKPGPDTQGGVPYVRVADFPNDRLNLSSIRRTTKEIDASYARARLREGDLLLSIRGTVGRVCTVPLELKGANITQDTARLSIQPSMNRDYVEWFLRAPQTQDRMKLAVKGVAVRGINIGDVRALQVPVPPWTEQNEIVKRVVELFGLADRVEERFRKSQARVDRLSRSLLEVAFRGELVSTGLKPASKAKATD